MSYFEELRGWTPVELSRPDDPAVVVIDASPKERGEGDDPLGEEPRLDTQEIRQVLERFTATSL